MNEAVVLAVPQVVQREEARIISAALAELNRLPQLQRLLQHQQPRRPSRQAAAADQDRLGKKQKAAAVHLEQ